MSDLQGEMLVTGLIITIIGVVVFLAAASVSASIQRGIRSLFSLDLASSRSALWGVRGAGIFFVLFGLALGALALFTI
ncbi:hypothetical protein SAMN02800687_0672 [Curtobacterium sp. UNCCL20]|uniref:hypothetical protein n=1 Tax=Curtobacterium sp. UNCCL20 TaxID=1502773 RepID=UPI00088B61C7|nr:hypothetical protein [Curtobacterium sp. UNCCL20]SDQ16983.1 hypothetical protein SAMN02800687_0672 [Curtobacterium sp. UNCCL20]